MENFKITKREEVTLYRSDLSKVKKILTNLADINNSKINKQMTTSDETGSHPMTTNELQDLNEEYILMLCDYLGLDEVYFKDGNHEPNKRERT